MLKKLFSAICLLIFSVSCQKDNSTESRSTELRLSSESDPATLDPRLARDLATITMMNSLYEGLVRSNATGGLDLAGAEEIQISDDHKTYTFKIRPNHWSDGSPVTAYDFEETWKSSLSPEFPAPNAYQLYHIKGAKEGKEGKLVADQMGIKAIDDQTLVVELEKPLPYFLELLTCPFYFPVHKQIREKGGQLETGTTLYAFNGPYELDHWSRSDEFVAKKNPFYWDSSAVKLEKISLVVLENNTMLNLFRQNELDWAGSPLSTIPTDAIPTLKDKGILEVAVAPGVYMIRLNCEKPPFNDKKIRQAFSYALNRKDLVDFVLLGNQIPATGFVPTGIFAKTPYYNPNPFFKDNDLEKARHLFEEALAENQMTREQLPTITVSYLANERYHKIAQVVQQQWKNAFGIEIALQVYESKSYLDQIRNHTYQAGLASWFGDFFDPITFLEVFQYKNNGTNNTQWESPLYTELLAKSYVTPNPQERAKVLVQAEEVLMNEMPVIPLFFASYNYMKAPDVKNVYFSDLAFKTAYKEAH